jgi:hypothetical protein
LTLGITVGQNKALDVYYRANCQALGPHVADFLEDLGITMATELNRGVPRAVIHAQAVASFTKSFVPT